MRCVPEDKANPTIETARTNQWRGQITEDYIRTIRVNARGALFEDVSGRLLPQGKSAAVRRFAEERGFTLASPRYTHGKLKKEEKKQREGNVQSVEA